MEMKAGKAIEKEVIQQLNGAEYLIAYCQKIGQLFWNNPNFITGYEYRFISLKQNIGLLASNILILSKF